MKHSRRFSGFTMLESAIVVTIVAIVAGLSLAAGNGILESGRRSATENKLTEIEKALDSFRRRNNRLPCPARYTTTDSDTYYGIEERGGSNGNSSIGAICDITNLSNTDYAVEGAVPARSLGLPDEFMLDGWGNKIHYAMDMNTAITDAFSVIKPGEACSVAVLDMPRDASGNYNTSPISYSRSTDLSMAISTTVQSAGTITSPVTDRNSTNKANRDIQGAAYALISHGKNGHGARSLNGGSIINAGATNYAENLNCHCNSSAVLSSNVGFYVQAEPNDSSTADIYFDDIVRFKRRYQLQTDTDINVFGNYKGPQLVTVDDDAKLKLYTNHCGYWRYTPVSSSGSGNDPTALTNVKAAMFTPQNGLFVFLSSSNYCNFYTYGLQSSMYPVALTDGINYDSAATSLNTTSAASNICAANRIDATFAMAAKAGTIAATSATWNSTPFVELWKYSSSTQSYEYDSTTTLFPNVDGPSSVPTLMSMSANGLYLLLSNSSYTYIYSFINSSSIQLKLASSTLDTNTYRSNLKAAAFSADENYLALGLNTSGTNSVKIFSIDKSSNTLTDTALAPNISQLAGTINGITFSPDGNYLAITTNSAASTTFDKNIAIFRLTYDTANALTLFPALGGDSGASILPSPASTPTYSSVTRYDVGSSAVNPTSEPTMPMFTSDSSYLVMALPSSSKTQWPLSIFRRVGVSGNYSFQLAPINDANSNYGYVAGSATNGKPVRFVDVSR